MSALREVALYPGRTVPEATCRVFEMVVDGLPEMVVDVRDLHRFLGVEDFRVRRWFLAAAAESGVSPHDYWEVREDDALPALPYQEIGGAINVFDPLGNPLNSLDLERGDSNYDQETGRNAPLVDVAAGAVSGAGEGIGIPVRPKRKRGRPRKFFLVRFVPAMEVAADRRDAMGRLVRRRLAESMAMAGALAERRRNAVTVRAMLDGLRGVVATMVSDRVEERFGRALEARLDVAVPDLVGRAITDHLRKVQGQQADAVEPPIAPYGTCGSLVWRTRRSR